MIPDNLTSVVTKADALEPRLNEAFVEYAQSRGFVIDAARVRTPTDKPRVERMVQFVRSSFWAGETFRGLADAQAKVEAWCAGRAGLRVHGTTQCRPLEHLRLEEQPRLDPHISVANARLQAARVADARGLTADAVAKLIDAHTDGRLLGVLGEPAVNVVMLNLALDELTA